MPLKRRYNPLIIHWVDQKSQDMSLKIYWAGVDVDVDNGTDVDAICKETDSVEDATEI